MESLIRVGVLVISDRCWRGETVDESGPAIRGALDMTAYVVTVDAIVPDEPVEIAAILREWADGDLCDVILTTGGTGFTARDTTPEATRAVIDREAPQIMMYLLVEALQVTAMAPLSRGVAGLRGKTLIVNLPGSPAGARHSTASLRRLLPHAVDLLHGRPAVHGDIPAET
jgi:molybdopterin adenylyltransferase